MAHRGYHEQRFAIDLQVGSNSCDHQPCILDRTTKSPKLGFMANGS